MVKAGDLFECRDCRLSYTATQDSNVSVICCNCGKCMCRLNKFKLFFRKIRGGFGGS